MNHRDPFCFGLEEDVVISGIGGRFPESDNIDELAENLYNHVDMITEDDRRWTPGLFGLPRRSGKISSLSSFDADFFGVDEKQANLMEPQVRLLLEVTFEALMDAGLNPAELRGSKTGVYIGCGMAEFQGCVLRDASKVCGKALTGCEFSMFANSISQAFDFRGPSNSMDTACSSSFFAFQQAMLGLKLGQCDMAVVGGVSIDMRPATALQFHKLNMLSADGRCKYLDSRANGYVRSEACSICVLQKSSDAKRIYATVVNAGTNTDGFKENGITFPSWRAQCDLLASTYKECKLDPNELIYLEAHGTGTAVGDPEETRAISEAVCKQRREPLLIGSVKTNLGHSEYSSGMCSLAKMIIALQNRKVPSIIHYESPNTDIDALVSGRIKPCLENTELPAEGYIGINSFGFGGVNVHVILKAFNKLLSSESVVDNEVPRLVLLAGRTPEACQYMIDWIEAHPNKVTREFLALIQEVFSTQIQGYDHRAYLLIKEPKQSSQTKESALATVPVTDAFEPENIMIKSSIERTCEKRPVWFVFPGMGAQWPAMAKGMMELPMFAASMRKSAEVLKPYNIDLLKLICDAGSEGSDSDIVASVAIAAVQVALVDLLREIGIEPDGIVGHSQGELGCAYADGCFSREQTLLSAYWRAKSSDEAQLPRGMMAAVGLSWAEAQQRCPEGIVPACHNSADSITISGPYEPTKKFVEQLNAEGVFAREVDSSGIAFHSHLVRPIEALLLKEFREACPEPKLRSSKWISSAIPESRWHEDLAKYASADYVVNNLLSPVLFKEAFEKVPRDAIVVEVAPHCLLQAIIKRNMSKDAVYIPLMKRNNNDHNLELLFSAIGTLYQHGYLPKIEKLYPKVEFPVSRGTQSLSPLIKWDHSQSWFVPKYPDYFNPSSNTDYTVECDINKLGDEYLVDHCIDGRIVFPPTGYLMLAWKMLAKIKGQFYDKMSVSFENVHLHRATILSKTEPTKFIVRIFETSGDFSVSESGDIVANGKVFPQSDELLLEEKTLLEHDPIRSLSYDEEVTLNQEDIYKELRIRGFDYGSQFRGLSELSLNKHRGKLTYNGNWVCFSDAMLQLVQMVAETRDHSLPVRIQSIRCNPLDWKEACEELSERVVDVVYNPHVNVVVAKGIAIRGLKFSLSPRSAQVPLLETQQFIAYTRSDALDNSSNLVVQQYQSVLSRALMTLVERIPKAAQLLNNEAGRQIKRQAEQINQEIYARFLNKPTEEMALLSSLKPILADQSVPIREAINALMNSKGYDRDLIANICSREHFLKPLVDTVLENLNSSKMRVLEVNSSSSIAYAELNRFLQTSNRITEVEYNIAHPDVESLPEEVISNPAIKIIDFNFNKPTLAKKLDGLDLIVYRDDGSPTVDHNSLLASAFESLKPKGFAIALLRTSYLPVEQLLHSLSGNTRQQVSMRVASGFVAKARTAGFTVIGQSRDTAQSWLVVLLRKIVSPCPVDKQTFIKVENFDYKWVDEVRVALTSANSKKDDENVWLIAEDTPNSGIVGLVNCLRHESGGSRIRSIFNKTGRPELLQRHLKELVALDLVSNVISGPELETSLGAYRHLSFNDAATDNDLQEADDVYLNMVTSGDSTSLCWSKSSNQHLQQLDLSQPNKQRCSIYYASLNCRDSILASGRLTLGARDSGFGQEFAGRDSQGKRVMGCVPGRSLATSVLVDDSLFLWPIPESWSMEEAATVPVVYATAYYALVVRGRLAEGDSVLIHSAAGGVGQAAISICLSRNCEVFCTVASQEERDFLKSRFPLLKNDHFDDSFSTSFEQHVLHQTSGKGVDLVLNSLSEEKLQASVGSLAIHGRFLEIGKYDLSEEYPLGMSAFLKNITFHGIMLDSLFTAGSDEQPIVRKQRRQVSELLSEGIKSGVVRPLGSKMFEHHQIEQAFRYMATGKHIGKVVVKIRDEELVSSDDERSFKLQSPATPVRLRALPRTTFNALKSYIITGGLGGFGLELAFWMVQRGARHLVLTSRTGPRDSFQRMSIKRLESLGASVLIYISSVLTAKVASNLILTSERLGPLGGIFNLAMVMRDALLENQSPQLFELVCEPKVDATINLDAASRNLSVETCDYFVAFSSVSCGRGNAGQSSSGFANSVMERVCEQRRQDGLHGLAIQWGPVGDVGVSNQIMSIPGGINIEGAVLQRIPSCLETLDKFLASPHAVCSSIVNVLKTVCSSGEGEQNLKTDGTKILSAKSTTVSSMTDITAESGLDSLMGIRVK